MYDDMNKLTELQNNQIQTLEKIVNEYVDKKIDRLNEGEKFAERFNLKRMAENIECDMAKRSHIFPNVSYNMTFYTQEAEKMLRKIIKERDI